MRTLLVKLETMTPLLHCSRDKTCILQTKDTLVCKLHENQRRTTHYSSDQFLFTVRLYMQSFMLIGPINGLF